MAVVTESRLFAHEKLQRPPSKNAVKVVRPIQTHRTRNASDAAPEALARSFHIESEPITEGTHEGQEGSVAVPDLDVSGYSAEIWRARQQGVHFV